MKKIELKEGDKITINGMPERYEFVRVGFAKQGELYLGSGDDNCKVIVRKIDEPKPLVIEAGKYYRLRNGNVVGPIVRLTGRYVGGLYDVWRSNGLIWTENGNYMNNIISSIDIVAEVPPPEPTKPKYIPWTYETCPVGSVVVNKTDDYKALVISAGLSSACFGVLDASYANLLDQYTQLDGTPCGTLEP